MKINDIGSLTMVLYEYLNYSRTLSIVTLVERSKKGILLVEFANNKKFRIQISEIQDAM